MSESELLLLFNETIGLNWDFLIWWFSITFGLYSIAYFAGEKLRLGAVLFIILTYTLLTYLIINQLLLNFSFANSLVNDLIALQNSGTQISNTSQDVINTNTGENVSIWRTRIEALALLFVALGGNVYLIYGYCNGQRARKEN